jgi:hypothetical protein
MRRTLPVLAAGLLVCAATAAAAAGKDRYGLMGRIESYDPDQQTVTVRVVETHIPEWANHVGKRPPREIRPGSTHVFSVQPEGSVLNRTVIRTQSGSALDNSATREGFVRAMQALPDDRLLGISLSPNGEGSEPAYKVMMIQIPRTLEEVMKRLDEISVED